MDTGTAPDAAATAAILPASRGSAGGALGPRPRRQRLAALPRETG